MAYLLSVCNAMIQEFLDICKKVGIPIALDKTQWATVRIIFLGILLDRQTGHSIGKKAESYTNVAGDGE